MLIDQHPDRYPAHVEPVEEVLYGVLSARVHLVRLLQLQHALSHRLHDVRVPVADVDQALAETDRDGDSVLCWGVGCGREIGSRFVTQVSVSDVSKIQNLRLNWGIIHRFKKSNKPSL